MYFVNIEMISFAGPESNHGGVCCERERRVAADRPPKKYVPIILVRI